MPFRRLATTALVAAVLLSTFSVAAQVRLRLTYTPPGSTTPKTCVYDTNLLSNDPATGDLTATGAFGQDCPSAAPPGTPSFSDPLTGDVPPTVTAGAQVRLTWRADADSCRYDGSSFPNGVTFADWPASGLACNDAATCTRPNVATLTMPATSGEYRFKLTCSKTGNPTPVVSEVATTVVAASACIAPAGLTRQMRASVCDIDGTLDCRDADATRFEQVFGTTSLNPSVVLPWPGRYNLQQRPLVNNNQYLALQFTVPSDYPTANHGYLGIAETWFDGRLTMTISTACGDFGETNQIAQRCILSGPEAASHPSQLGWTTQTSGSVYQGLCPLQRGQTYYLNILYAPIATPLQTTCGGPGSCQRSIQNGPGRF